MSSISNVEFIPLLSRKEEIKLNKQIKKGDQKARDFFIQANLRLVIFIAYRFKNCPLDLDELIQEGNLGLIKAVDKFDYRRANRFSTVGIWWIYQAIFRAIQNKGTLVRVPSHIYTQQKVNEMAKEIINSAKNIRSLDQPLAATPCSKGDSLHNIIPSTKECLLNDIISKDLKIKIDKQLQKILSPRSYFIIVEYYGLLSNNPRTLENIGQDLNITRERVRQIKTKELKRLKKYFKQFKQFKN